MELEQGLAPKANVFQPAPLPASEPALLFNPCWRAARTLYPHSTRSAALRLHATRVWLRCRSGTLSRLIDRKLFQHSYSGTTRTRDHFRPRDYVFRHALCRADSGRLARNRDRGQYRWRFDSRADVALSVGQVSFVASGASVYRLRRRGLLLS